jgi:UDP-N-acetylglucosamine--N-acetylmuramyl-(pentapeptide) pyrophosphoryl-undecaprenol N-acetylglucosamine transferase
MSEGSNNKSQPVVVLAGGGTGGHVYPALAMGEALAARGAQLRYYGDGARLEGRVVPERGISFTPVTAAQFPRAGLLAKARFAVSLLRGIVQVRSLLRRDRAAFVLGVGGYVMAPTVLAAWTLGIPTAVHEANVTPGLANRLCARVAKLVLLTYAETASKLPGSAPRERVGCPVNPAVTRGDRSAALARYGFSGERPVVLVVGGSLGARTICELGERLAGKERPFDLLFVTGPSYFEAVKGRLDPLPPGLCLLPYEGRMADAFAVADLVVCRAGSSTLAELTAVGLPSVLIPSPNVTDNHQEGNARGLEKVGAARVIVEKGLDLDAAVAEIAALMADGPARAKMAAAARSQGQPGTAEKVAGLIYSRFFGGAP